MKYLAQADQATKERVDQLKEALTPIDPGRVDLYTLFDFTLRTLITIAAIVSIVYLVWAGIQYITAAGDEERMKKARGAVIGAIIGIIIIVLSYILIIWTADVVKEQFQPVSQSITTPLPTGNRPATPASRPTRQPAARQGANQPSPGTTTITVSDFAFTPAHRALPLAKGGTTVVWENKGATQHILRQTSGSTIAGPSSVLLLPGGKTSFTFTRAGIYSFDCGIHPEMTGVIETYPVRSESSGP